MKKKILSIIMASAMLLSAAGTAIADEKTNPDVYVDDAKIIFEDQKAVIENERTLVPVRGVFEAMGASVDWEQETKTVTIESKDNTIRIVLTIDNPTMTVYTFTSLLAADKAEVTLDVAPQLINDRTMIPLRAISESLKADVQWNQEDYLVDITTTDKPESKETLPALSLSADAAAVKAGEEFNLYINLANITPETIVSSVSAGLTYSKADFELVNAVFCDAEGTVVETALANTESYADRLIAFAVTANAEAAAKTDGAVMKLTFKALTDNEGAFALTDDFNAAASLFDTTLILSAGTNDTLFEGNDLNVDTTPVVINGADAVEATVDPAVTEAPEETADPAATEAPEETADPEATTEPEATVDPAATEAPTATEAPAEATAEPEATPAA